MSTPVTVWIIQPQRPWKPVEVFSATLSTDKGGSSWAYVERISRRFKVGATAFLTPEAAERRRHGKAAQFLEPNRVRVLNRIGAGGAVAASSRVQPPKVYRGQVRL